MKTPNMKQYLHDQSADKSMYFDISHMNFGIYIRND
jgi:hypothetical protein